ncbi:MAG: cytochrome c-type biogenesis protein CcmH [Bradymonadaceae bacterium]
MLFFVAAILCLLLPATSVAQTDGQSNSSTAAQASEKRTEGEVSNVVEELSQEIESPFCPGKTLAMCPSGGAAKVRRDIQRKAEKGMSKEEIKEAILEEHGEEFRLREPPTKDHYPLIAAVAFALLICIGAVVYLSRRGGDDTDDDGPEDGDLSDEDELYLEELRSQYQE